MALIDIKKIDQVCRRYDCSNAPGIAVGVALSGKPIYRKGFGLCNIEVPMTLTPSTRMSVGSVTKQFACLAYLLLCERNVASVADPVSKYLRKIHPTAQRITVGDLMCHQSGLRDATDIIYQFNGRGRCVSADEIVHMYESLRASNYEPGVRFNYNNGGFIALARIVEEISGHPFEAFLSSEIFDPVGMHDTFLRRWDTTFTARSALQHYRSPDGRFEERYLGVEGLGQGGLLTTIDDMLRWLKHMDAPVVGCAETWSLMKTPRPVRNGANTGYGFGLISGQYRGVDFVCHPGNVAGGNAQMIKVPSAGLDIVVIANRSDANSRELANSIIDVCVPALDPPLTGVERAPLEGIYRSDTTGSVVQFTAATDGQKILIDGFPLEFVYVTHHELVPSTFWSFFKLSFRIVDEADGGFQVLFEDAGNIQSLRPVNCTSSFQGNPLQGSFRCDEGNVEMHFTSHESMSACVCRGEFGNTEYKTVFLGENIWRLVSDEFPYDGGILQLQMDGDGLSFSTGRNPNLVFSRSV